MPLEPAEIKALRPDALTPAEIEAKAEAIGEAKASMHPNRAFALSIMAGLFIGMGGMFMLLVKSDATLSFGVSSLLGGFVFCLGLFLVITVGAELFTGNCLMVCGSLSKRYTWVDMLKSWALVYVGNLVGSLIMVAILYLCNYGSMNSGAVGDMMITVACGKINQGWFVIFVKGIMCNFLVCLAVWVSFGARTITDKFFSVLLPITAFVACGFEHCVANMFFLPMGLLMKITGWEYGGKAAIDCLTAGGVCFNISAATLGNIVGGAVFVALLYWLAFARKKSKPDEKKDEAKESPKSE